VVEKEKGKAKEVATSPRGGEKRKKKKTVAKVVDDDDIVEIPGLSGQRSGFNPEPFLERLDRLTGVRLSEGRGQNNQQPTPNDNNKRVVVFLCGSGR